VLLHPPCLIPPACAVPLRVGRKFTWSWSCVKAGSWFDRILERGYYTERQAAKVCRTMVEVLHFIHSQGIIHRDLKPENVLLISKKSDTRLKVIDFGMAIYVKKGTPHSRAL